MRASESRQDCHTFDDRWRHRTSEDQMASTCGDDEGCQKSVS
jgi:hypothetical protein